MATRLVLSLLCLVITAVLSEPLPGRIPKVYNALITSNQNLEPSKAYPVYQPIIHDPFPFPYHPALFYGGDFITNNRILPLPPSKESDEKPPQPAPSSETPSEMTMTEAPQPKQETDIDNKSSSPPPPPNTESPIPLNEFGLPPQVLPLGRIDPIYNGFTHVSPFTYTYPNIRFYDPYEPFNYNPYITLPPFYRPLSNLISKPFSSPKLLGEPAGNDKTATPPPEPSNLSVLNYSSKDPSIPNVPPPPLLEGGLKQDKTE